MKTFAPYASLLSFAFALFAFTGCDIVDGPVPPGTAGGGGGTDTSNSVKRRVLIEDFTGHTCNNCPGAALIAQNLQNIYGDDVIIAGVHVTGFAAPQPPPSPYTTDFRTAAGNAYAQTFQIFFLPAGAINRKEVDGSIIQSESAWSTAVGELIGQPADLDVKFSSFNFNAATNTVEVEVQTIVINPVTGDHDLIIYLIEDHIIAPQLNADASPPDVLDYDHRHVLRDNVNSAWGENVITASVLPGDTITRSYTYQLSSNVLEPNNCSLIAYVARTDNYEIMQVSEHKFSE